MKLLIIFLLVIMSNQAFAGVSAFDWLDHYNKISRIENGDGEHCVHSRISNEVHRIDNDPSQTFVGYMMMLSPLHGQSELVFGKPVGDFFEYPGFRLGGDPNIVYRIARKASVTANGTIFAMFINTNTNVYKLCMMLATDSLPLIGNVSAPTDISHFE